ncbi:hypothetical protein [Kyrpidia sp.]|uniref:hypothetical protein n=1 Tax=Kyrpidia sp. TaxID=2073077 RepID=UPI002590A55E|nr:hypothetical protein [Kyrpidia sp.]MCL6577093.1 hypothetical protein [Kyrpidia sp.]
MILQQWISDLLEEARHHRDVARRHPEDKFESGIAFAYYDILTRSKNAAIRLDFDPKTVGLEIDLDREFLP